MVCRTNFDVICMDAWLISSCINGASVAVDLFILAYVLIKLRPNFSHLFTNADRREEDMDQKIPTPWTIVDRFSLHLSLNVPKWGSRKAIKPRCIAPQSWWSTIVCLFMRCVSTMHLLGMSTSVWLCTLLYQLMFVVKFYMGLLYSMWILH